MGDEVLIVAIHGGCANSEVWVELHSPELERLNCRCGNHVTGLPVAGSVWYAVRTEDGGLMMKRPLTEASDG